MTAAGVLTGTPRESGPGMEKEKPAIRFAAGRYIILEMICCLA
jgi:hypothetical protein